MLLPSITSNSNDLTFTQSILVHYQDISCWHNICWSCIQTLRARLSCRTIRLAWVHLYTLHLGFYTRLHRIYSWSTFDPIIFLQSIMAPQWSFDIWYALQPWRSWTLHLKYEPSLSSLIWRTSTSSSTLGLEVQAITIEILVVISQYQRDTSSWIWLKIMHVFLLPDSSLEHKQNERQFIFRRWSYSRYQI